MATTHGRGRKGRPGPLDVSLSESQSSVPSVSVQPATAAGATARAISLPAVALGDPLNSSTASANSTLNVSGGSAADRS